MSTLYQAKHFYSSLSHPILLTLLVVWISTNADVHAVTLFTKVSQKLLVLAITFTIIIGTDENDGLEACQPSTIFMPTVL